ncbi:MAG TPA: type II 3-dehydroquinate dehydratase [Candidatus Omnitrophica bacterium]|nr:MAG: type II 3-dehydroquinate dehydratase [Candidatus Omnitrophota bacterium]RKY44703.1 MAG: type II 3-dehydroquinate dehydratase [Candidatus Omnitrophota bacterium]HEC68934.1 type II 3-dehydroquinate dehydratase [Candidatus Omnitrophota bacterium]
MKIKKNKKVLVIHGPNLNLLGKREVSVYGKTTLRELNTLLKKEAKKLNLSLETFQSNSEGEIVNKINSSLGKVDFIIINPAAYTHTSVAIRDALLSVEIPTIEVHLSNIFAREEFRKKSLISDVVKGVISGLGIHSYLLALKAVKALIS